MLGNKNLRGDRKIIKEVILMPEFIVVYVSDGCEVSAVVEATNLEEAVNKYWSHPVNAPELQRAVDEGDYDFVRFHYFVETTEVLRIT